MLTWLLFGYLAVSMLTSLFIYASYVAAARADAAQEHTLTPAIVPHHPTKPIPLPVETLSLSTI